MLHLARTSASLHHTQPEVFPTDRGGPIARKSGQGREGARMEAQGLLFGPCQVHGRGRFGIGQGGPSARMIYFLFFIFPFSHFGYWLGGLGVLHNPGETRRGDNRVRERTHTPTRPTSFLQHIFIVSETLWIYWRSCKANMSRLLANLSRRKFSQRKRVRTRKGSASTVRRRTSTTQTATKAVAAPGFTYPFDVGLTTATQAHGVVDLRSDTVTLPTAEMRAAMAA